MRRAALITGGALAVVGAAAFARSRLQNSGQTAEEPPEDAAFSVYAPGGRYRFMATGPVGWMVAMTIPFTEAGVHRAVAEMLDSQPDDELLDIGCGPGVLPLANPARWRTSRMEDMRIVRGTRAD